MLRHRVAPWSHSRLYERAKEPVQVRATLSSVADTCELLDCDVNWIESQAPACQARDASASSPGVCIVGHCLVQKGGRNF